MTFEESPKTSFTVSSKILFSLLGPLLALLLYTTLGIWDIPTVIRMTAAISMWTAIWWIFEPIPIPITSLIPLALLPFFGILSPSQVGTAYGSPLVLLLMGGFILSTAMAKSGAHRRIALTMVNAFGSQSSKRLVFGFMAASAFLSMWISNTATTLMLLPVALAVLEKSHDKAMAVPLLLGIAYAASIGGIGTPIGTPPNLVFREVYEINMGSEIGFLTWMSWGIPVVLLMLPLTAIWITRNLHYKGNFDLPEVGIWTSSEKRVLLIFSLTALAWITRSQPFGGWSDWFGVSSANDASVAMLAVVCMFLVPDGKGARLLDWETANKIPWGMLILFGGGIAIATAFVESGLSGMLGEWLSAIASMNIILVVCLICFTITFMTEMTSNTATTTLMLPILAAAALGANLDPTLLMVPAAMSASCAFMLPVATAPNTIMFSTGYFTTRTMAKEGFILNLIGVAVISFCCLWLR